MTSRFLIWLSALALLVLLVVQYIFITETYGTKRQQFDARFSNLVRSGMIAFKEQEEGLAFDSVLYLLDNMAVDYLFLETDSLEKGAVEAFQDILEAYHEPEDFLRAYVREAGAEPDFTYHVFIRELYLVDTNLQQRVNPDSSGVAPPPAGALLAGSYTYERNFFRVTYDIYINFLNRSLLILQEMWLILALDILTLLFVFFVFFITLRNLLLQKRLSEMKSDFINNMTHELKTPLSTIAVASSSLGNRSIIQQENRVEELSEVIRKQNRHLSELIDRILDIHIWERDQVKLKPVRVDPEAWIRELADAFLINQGKNGIEIDLQVDKISRQVVMDDVHMSTVINNLLANAVKYGNTPCKIRIGLTGQEGVMTVTVTDNGPGIRKEELKHIFEKFYRGEQSRERVVRGLGLGLYYVKKIVEAHLGTVTVLSTPGQGTKFIIQIPVENGSAAG